MAKMKEPINRDLLSCAHMRTEVSPDLILGPEDFCQMESEMFLSSPRGRRSPASSVLPKEQTVSSFILKPFPRAQALVFPHWQESSFWIETGNGSLSGVDLLFSLWLLGSWWTVFLGIHKSQFICHLQMARQFPAGWKPIYSFLHIHADMTSHFSWVIHFGASVCYYGTISLILKK